MVGESDEVRGHHSIDCGLAEQGVQGQMCYRFSVSPHLRGILPVFSSSLGNFRLCITSVSSLSRI